MLIWILLIVLLLLAVGGLPTWPYSAGWGYGYAPTGIVGVLIVILLVLLLLGRI